MKHDKRNKNQETESTEVQPKVYLNHGPAVTRRDMLKAGLIQFGAAATLPSVIEWLAKAGVAEAADCSAAAGPGMPAFVHYSGAGGFGIMSQPIIGTVEDPNVLLPHYGTLGLGSGSNLVTQGLISLEFKNQARFYSNSGFLAGLRTGATTADLQKTVFVAIPCQTNDDSNMNEFDPTGGILKAGRSGSSLPNLGSQQSATGGRHKPAYVNPPSPLVVGGYSDLARAIQVAGALGSLSLNQKTKVFKLINRLTTEQARVLAASNGGKEIADLAECATGTNLNLVGSGNAGTDPRTDGAFGTQLSTAWGINAGTADNNRNLVFGASVYNALKDNASTVNLVVGGCDYHGDGRNNQDVTDTTIGLAVGRTIRSAAIMGKKCFIMVSTDGAVSAPSSDTAGAGFTSDSGGRGGCYMIAYDPAGTTTASSMQIGGMTTGQVASTAVKTGGAANVAAAAVYVNYLAFANQISKVDMLGARVFSQDELDNKIIKING